MTANASTASTQSEQDPHPTTRLDLLRNRPLMTMMLGHFTVDMYSGVIPLLYPLLTDKFDLSLSTVGSRFARLQRHVVDLAAASSACSPIARAPA